MEGEQISTWIVFPDRILLGRMPVELARRAWKNNRILSQPFPLSIGPGQDTGSVGMLNPIDLWIHLPETAFLSCN